ncbi:hypothetical protein GCM10009836_03220 [Pseudonocardia ailaonensis]|uniref:DNA primase/polymerase bifunctional N-terminal domain-containing protein n=1 Tax=Pseudonocardia ailaonensis TaxID=367279 RepID=A0ABN2MLM6_9PSEU
MTTRAPHRRALLAAAERAAAAGLHVFPVRPGGKTPAVEAWETAASTDPATVRRWWTARPYNIGLAVGRSRILVVDLDTAHRPDDRPPPHLAGCHGGADVLARLAHFHRHEVPTTLSVSTPSGGSHLYFRMPYGVELRNSQGRLGWKIDTRGAGGYVLAAGSRRHDGRTYRGNDEPIAELPDWITELLLPANSDEGAPGLADGRLPARRAGAYLAAIVDRELTAMAAARSGTRHTARLRAARVLGQLVAGGELDHTAAHNALLDAASNHLGADTSVREIDRDIRDGLKFGMRRPRRITRVRA